MTQLALPVKAYEDLSSYRGKELAREHHALDYLYSVWTPTVILPEAVDCREAISWTEARDHMRAYELIGDRFCFSFKRKIDAILFKLKWT